MRIQDVLVQMESAALSTDFTKAVEALYWQQVSSDHFDETENEYEAGKTCLMALLPEDEVASLRELEHRYAENMEYASRFSFKCGMYCAFMSCRLLVTAYFLFSTVSDRFLCIYLVVSYPSDTFTPIRS